MDKKLLRIARKLTREEQERAAKFKKDREELFEIIKYMNIELSKFHAHHDFLGLAGKFNGFTRQLHFLYDRSDELQSDPKCREIMEELDKICDGSISKLAKDLVEIDKNYQNINSDFKKLSQVLK